MTEWVESLELHGMPRAVGGIANDNLTVAAGQ
ncbi:hypothetical protein FBZ81_101151 [Azospirillum brasilense]|nr:hypothetical protein FBZ81_101151 [Azospirillum brasilense]